MYKHKIALHNYMFIRYCLTCHIICMYMYVEKYIVLVHSTLLTRRDIHVGLYMTLNTILRAALCYSPF